MVLFLICGFAQFLSGNFAIFDIGSGKGFLSLLLSFLMPAMLPKDRSVKVKKIVMIDRNFSFVDNDTRVGKTETHQLKLTSRERHQDGAHRHC